MTVMFLLNHKNSVLLCPMIFAIVLTIIGIVAAYVCGSCRFSTIWRMCTSSFGKWPLFVVIVVWVLFALLVFTVLGWLWGRGGYWSWQRWLTNWRSVGTEAASLELVKISLTTIGGIGGVGYLVIKYRERASAERGAADARLPWSIEQLANKSPQIRIAAIYSLADIADIYRGNFRQRVVNVLCGYLRTKRGDWSREHRAETSSASNDGFDAIRRIAKKWLRNNQPSRMNQVKDPHYENEEGSVESTAITVIADHLRENRSRNSQQSKRRRRTLDSRLWCDCAFDLHEAIILKKLDFNLVTLYSDIDVSGAKLMGGASFGGALIGGKMKAEGALFSGATSFAGSVFRGHASFVDAVFEGSVDFVDASIRNGVDFAGAIFNWGMRDKISFSDEIINEGDSLPAGARWAQFDEFGNFRLIEGDTLDSSHSKSRDSSDGRAAVQ